ncbi:MAG TPA: energy transducer TonB [Candidatus Polarisedimenticolaceae bacterium]|nr:energy transducer TonB [Candidatus Polarisedimenticolaceae bacterium]
MPRPTILLLGLLLIAGPAIAGGGQPKPENEPIEVGPGVDPPKPAMGSYLPAKLFAATAGAAVVRALIGVDGDVEKVEIVEASDPRLAALAQQMMTSRKFEPARRDGHPVAVWWKETLRFKSESDELESIEACHEAIPPGQPLTDMTDVEVPVAVRPAIVETTAAMHRKPGSVTLQCVVDTCGHVHDCDALNSSGPEYEEAARSAAGRALFSPARRHGEAVAVFYTFRIDIRFR